MIARMEGFGKLRFQARWNDRFLMQAITNRRLSVL